jgi:hypothetical protein
MDSGDTSFNHSFQTLFHPAPPTSVSTISSQQGPTPSRRFDYERTLLENEETRRSANMEFSASASCLLTGVPAIRSLTLSTGAHFRHNKTTFLRSHAIMLVVKS